MTTLPTLDMPDVQSREDHRQIDLDAVGISKLRWPVTIHSRDGEPQQVVATISLSVDLPRHFKGTHLSRFLETMESRRQGLSLDGLRDVLDAVKERLEAESAHGIVEFDYFIPKSAPVTGATAPMAYHVSFLGKVNGSKSDMQMRVAVPVTSVCPCSKEISEYGAHNQRGLITATTRSTDWLWVEEVVQWAEASASCALYPILKRPDEKWVTEHAYDHPVFVEDMVRNLAGRLMVDGRITHFEVIAENDESIHAHNAWARVEWAHDES